jgi:drug/metabolite transporter (DMT)-like permease
MILAYLFLGQVPSTNQIIGAALIVLAGIIATRKIRK